MLKMLIHAHFSVLMGILTSKAGHINLVFGLWLEFIIVYVCKIKSFYVLWPGLR